MAFDNSTAARFTAFDHAETLPKAEQFLELLTLADLPISMHWVKRFIRCWQIAPEEGGGYLFMGESKTKVGGSLLQIANNVGIELGTKTFVAIEHKNIGLFQVSEPLFGANVSSQFPSLTYEIEEAGKCLALGRSTAAAFHAIRSLEAVIQSICGVGVGIVADVFLGGVVNGLVSAFEGATDRGVDAGVISHKPAVSVSVTGGDGIQIVRGHIRHVEVADPAAALDQGGNSPLRRNRAVSSVVSLATDVSFVGFDAHTIAAKLRTAVRVSLRHCLPDAMAEEPSGFHAAAERPVKLLSADALLAGAHHIDSLEPNPHRGMDRLEHGSHTNGEWLAAGIAFVEAWASGLALEFANPIHPAAVVTDRTGRPKLRFDVGEGASSLWKWGSDRIDFMVAISLATKISGSIGYVALPNNGQML